MTLDQVVLWVIVGGVAGLLADAMVKRIRVGVVGAIVIGVLGALIGGRLFGALGVAAGGGTVGEVVKAAVGAVGLLMIVRAARKL